MASVGYSNGVVTSNNKNSVLQGLTAAQAQALLQQ